MADQAVTNPNAGWAGWNDIASSGLDSTQNQQNVDLQQTLPNAGQQQQSQQTTKIQEAPSQERFFQSAFDKHASYLKQHGIEVKPDVDPSQIYEPLIKSHQYVKSIQENPSQLIDIVKKQFPNYRIQGPDYNTLVREQLAKEFGEDFQPDPTELIVNGSLSQQYWDRRNELIGDIKESERQQRFEVQRQQALQEEARLQSRNTQVTEASKELNMPVEQVEKYLEVLGDPNKWSIKNLVILAQLVSGDAEYEMPNIEAQNNLQNGSQNSQGIPPSLVNLVGNTAEQKGFLDGVFG